MTENLISQLIRTQRRTVALQITPEARLIVRAPEKLPLPLIHQVVQEKMPWILKRQRLALEASKRLLVRKYETGERFLYLGEGYPLGIVASADYPLVFNQTEFLLRAEYVSHGPRIFARWYQKKLYGMIGGRVRHYANAAGLEYAKISVTHAVKQWGSCGSKGTLNFSWRLMMAPLSVIDYVVVHELAHLEIRNHSRRFWRKVGALLPDYPIARKWLHENQSSLTVE